MPTQSVAAAGMGGTIEVDPAFVDGLRDLAEFSHLIVLTHLHLIEGYSLDVIPFLDDRFHGVFAMRSPKRPNPIGFSIVHLLGIEESTLHIDEIDLVDGTPVLDLKPCVPAFDGRETERIVALALVMVLCLLVYRLAEHRLRERLASTGQTVPNQLKQPTTRPTMRWMFQCFEGITLVWFQPQIGPPHAEIAGVEPLHQPVECFGPLCRRGWSGTVPTPHR